MANENEMTLDEHLAKEAETHDPHIQFLLCRYYEKNNDYEKSFEWAQKSAEQGHASALYNLGVMYYLGEGTTKNEKKAEQLFKEAIDNGYDLDEMRENGNDYNIHENYELAVVLYRLAAEQGEAYAQFRLGVMYFFGVGVEKNYEEADKLFKEAIDNGYDLNEMCAQADCYCDNQDYEIGFLLYKFAAEQGHAEAQFELGVMYYFGDGVDENYEEAENLFKEAIENGYDLDSMRETADDYYRDEDYELAFLLYSLGAEQGDSDAQLHLGWMYYKGLGTEKDCNEALEYFGAYFYDSDNLIIENDVLYSSDKSIIYDYNGPDLETYEIPDSVKIIRNGAFFNHVKSVYVPKDCEIEDGAFDEGVEIIRRK